MNASRPRAVLLGVQLPDTTDVQHTADLAELGRLVKTLGLDVVATVSQKRKTLRSGTVVGLGKLKELSKWTGGDGIVAPKIPAANRRGGINDDNDDGEPVKDLPEPEADELDDSDDDSTGDPTGEKYMGRVDVVVVNHELSPRMQTNLEQATGAEVLDRTHVIVEIFHRHANTREARLQVEMARLAYVAPRLRAAGAGGDRTRGGIGGKGAGESKMELDRRKIRDRIAELGRELEAINRDAGTRRRARHNQRRVALVGYTNAGKSSLMRALTGSGVYVANKLFATLDTTVRALQPECEPRILASDTVGFIQKLPHQLVASFRSTLDEAHEASLLLFVADASDPTFRDQLKTTRDTLHEIDEHGSNEAEEDHSLLILNKRDMLTDEALAALQTEFPDALFISAHDPKDVKRVREAIIAFFDGPSIEACVFLPHAKRALVKVIYEQTEVVSETHDEKGTHFELRGPAAVLERLNANLET